MLRPLICRHELFDQVFRRSGPGMPRQRAAHSASIQFLQQWTLEVLQGTLEASKSERRLQRALSFRQRHGRGRQFRMDRRKLVGSSTGGAVVGRSGQTVVPAAGRWATVDRSGGQRAAVNHRRRSLGGRSDIGGRPVDRRVDAVLTPTSGHSFVQKALSAPGAGTLITDLPLGSHNGTGNSGRTLRDICG